MLRILSFISVFASVFLTQNALAKEFQLPSGDFSELRRTGTAKVLEAISPLTVRLDDGRFIHLAGLDFPDLDFYEPGDLSLTTVEILNDFLIGHTVVIYQTKSKDAGRANRMGHHIAHLVRLDKDVWVQGMILSLGLARTRTTKYNPDMASQMLKLEKDARRIKEGLWGMKEFGLITPTQAARKIGSYQIVEGIVKNVSRQKNTIYLNFGNNWRDDFTVSMTSTNLRSFTKHKMYPKDWNGKRIRVRGWIESWNGPHIKIDHPERFELLFTNTPQPKKAAPSKPKPRKDPGSALPTYND